MPMFRAQNSSFGFPLQTVSEYLDTTCEYLPYVYLWFVRVDRMTTRSIVLEIILLLALAVGIVLPGSPQSAAPAPMTSFSGGTFEASGVAHVPNTDAVLFVDDGRPNEIFLMQLGADRKQAGAIKTIDIATSIIDLEGITTDGEYFYVVGSQSKSKGADQAGLARFKFDAASQRAVGTQAASGLKRFLANNVAELRASRTRNITTAESTSKASRGIRGT